MIALEPVQVEELLASAQGEEGPSDGGGAATDLSVSVPDLLEVGVVCAGGDQLIVSTHDM